MTIEKSTLFNISRLGLYGLFLLFFAMACKDKEESYCEINLLVKTEHFYQGCLLPISVEAGDGVVTASQVKLIINHFDLGFINTSPNKYYWDTSDSAAGEYSIKALFLASNQSPPMDEKIINLIPVNVSCPEEVTDYDGNTYPVVQIGNQCWMKENLKVTHYPDGEPLVNGSDSLESLNSNAFGITPTSFNGWYFRFQNDSINANTFGFLYDWATTMNGTKAANNSAAPIQGICPDGWHVPDADEWQQLIDFTGGVHIAANKLKDNSGQYWTNNIAGVDNASGFTALPGGCFVPPVSFLDKGKSAYFWTATETISNHADHIFLKNSDAQAFVLGHQDSKRFGYAVRCVKDQ